MNQHNQFQPDEQSSAAVANNSNHIAPTSEDERLKQLEKSARVNLRRKVDAPPFVIRIDGIGALPRKDLFAIKAKSKMGKTQAASIIMAGVLGDESLGITVAEPYKTKVVYFDTEQADYNTIMVGHRVHRLLGWEEESNNARFRVYNLREWEWEDKMPFIEYVIANFRPTLVVIDGIADLLLNFNDEEKSAICILNLMKLASKTRCSVGCVLHENKAKDNDSMKGHLGTLLLQKAGDVFQVKKDNGVFTMKQTETRNKPVGDIAWVIDDNGYVMRQDKEPQQIKTEVKVAKSATWRQVFALINSTAARYMELSKAYCEVTKCSRQTAERRIKEAVETGLLSKNADGFYAIVLA